MTMHLPAILAGIVLLVAPAGYFAATRTAEDPTATVDVAAAGPHTHPSHAHRAGDAASSSTMGLLRVRIEHHGAPQEGHLRVLASDGTSVHEETITMDGTFTFDLELPVDAYTAEIDTRASDPQLESFSGSADLDLRECATSAAETLFQTVASPNGGIVVHGALCMDAQGMTDPQRHVGVKEMGAGVRGPAPTCPLQCTMGYSFLGNDGLAFEVAQDASRVDIGASWSTTATGAELAVWLYKPAGCSGCWEGIRGEKGTDRVTFDVDGLAAGTYRISAHPTGPVGVSAGEHLMIHAYVTA